MFNYKFHPTLILRTPVFNYTLYSEENLTALLKHPLFKRAIYFSSEVFYNELEKLNFDLKQLDKKAINTLKKYFNRMCYRPTPFGISSAFGTVNWDDDETNIRFCEDNLHPHVQFSYAQNIAYANTILDTNRDSVIFKLTSAIYKAGNEYRFIRSNSSKGQTEFLIDSLNVDRFFGRLIKFLKIGHTYPQIVNYLIEQADCTDIEAENYMQWLIESQLVTHANQPNITGDDYLARLLRNIPGQAIKSNFEKVTAINTVNDLENMPGADDDLNSADFYVNLNLKLPNSNLTKTYQQDILDGLNCLDHFTTGQNPTALNNFTSKFAQKFDGQTIPLLNAIDPEIGVGYNDLAVEEDDINIAQNIIEPGSATNQQLPWGHVQNILFNKWRNIQHSGDDKITITDDDLKQLNKGDDTFPNTISVMFRIVANKVLIESAGGVSAAALAGRFTPIDTEIHQLTIDTATYEALANPDIIFAEIAHICHDKTANIDRREHIYLFEIPVMVQSTMPVEQQIPLSDLWVSVANGQVVLQSHKFGKRVVPRLSSAFNYTRTDLAVFRFLCDMQKAYLKTNWTFNFNALFPGQNHYPRIEYKNTILHLAQWIIKKETFDNCLSANGDSKLSQFNIIQSKLNLPDAIALTQHDHQLVFNLKLEADILFFLDCVKGQSQVTVKEYLLPINNKPIIQNQKSEAHVNQFIASLYHQRQIYKPVTTLVLKSKILNRKFLPGSEWLYLKIYCHSMRSNELLVSCIEPVVKKLMKKKLISEWFFIRYLDPEHHIRLRLHAADGNLQQILAVFYNAIKPYVHNGIVANYNIAPYERELERYSDQFMPQFENCFYADSNFILWFLKQSHNVPSTQTILEFALVSTKDILINLGLSGSSLINFLERVSNSFIKEFEHVSELKHQLDTEFRRQKNIIEQVIQHADNYCHSLNESKARMIFIDSLLNLKRSTDHVWKENWIADMIHMHLNRLFTSSPRKQEMMVYYFLLKNERSIQARKMRNQR